METSEIMLELKLHMSCLLYFSRVQSFKKIKHLIYGSHPWLALGPAATPHT